MIEIAGTPIGDAHETYIVFEAGPTHNGLDSAKRLIRSAAEAGAHAIKFQIIDADRLIADPTVTIDYGILKKDGTTETVTEPLIAPLQRRMMTADEWREAKAEADALGLAFFATVCFPEEVDFVRELGAHSIKIASADVDQLGLIEYAAKTGLCIQLDTGNASLGEIEKAVDCIKATGNLNIIIHHCPTGYPARIDGVNLSILSTLKSMFDVPVAFSDHSTGWEMDIAAVVLGANLIEKTITEDRTTPSIEHVMSMEPHEAAAFVEAVRNVRPALGQKRRVLSEAEVSARSKVRRSAFARRAMAAGEKIDLEDVDFRRPGTGITYSEFVILNEKPLSTDLSEGDALTISHF